MGALHYFFPKEERTLQNLGVFAKYTNFVGGRKWDKANALC